MFAILVCALVALPAWSFAHNDMDRYDQKDDNWQKLQSFRVWTIIDTLGLDASSEKGIALLEIINKTAEKDREYYQARMANSEALHKALERQPIDEAEVARIVEEFDRLNAGQLELKAKEAEAIKKLLTPLERAKLMIADEKFRLHLRQAMHGAWRDERKGPPRER
jgi:hypothetical protein